MATMLTRLGLLVGVVLLFSGPAQPAPTTWTLHWAYPFRQVTPTGFEVRGCVVTPQVTCAPQLVTLLDATARRLPVQVPDPPQIQCFQVRAITVSGPSPFTALLCAIKEP